MPLHTYPVLFLHCLTILADLLQALMRNWSHMPHTVTRLNCHPSCALSLPYPSYWAQEVVSKLLSEIHCSLALLLIPKVRTAALTLAFAAALRTSLRCDLIIKGTMLTVPGVTPKLSLAFSVSHSYQG